MTADIGGAIWGSVVLAQDENNYSPPSFGTLNVLVNTVTPNLDRVITGFAAPVGDERKSFIYVNRDTADKVTLKHQDAGSSALNRPGA